ncbi:PHP domain-containing protein [Candidatus Palauibacter sp.]|uniref:PHP domain-containing protein n=1 Tax=Candidatus Palauibacter sp. TaxID=3101350 RepID=UPI003B0229B4
MSGGTAGGATPGAGAAAGVDLHLHSTHSDGTLPVDEVVRTIAEAGLAGFALTDHDTTSGLAEAEAAARRHGLSFLPGAELSANEPGRSVHLLAFGFDREHPGLQDFLHRYREDRRRRARRIVELLQAAGVALTDQDVERQTGAAAPTRAHVARALVAGGHVSDLNAVFRLYLSRGCPAFVRKKETPPKLVFDQVHAAGGVVCVAHPGKVHGVDDVRRWAGEGLDGVEVVHPANKAAVQARMKAVADELGLLTCGGSDWHGPNTGRRSPGWAHVPARWMEAIRARTHFGRAARRNSVRQ